MSIIQSQRQESEYWSTEIPSSDVQLLTKEAKKIIALYSYFN